MFYARFDGYRPFGEGYGCPLDFEGGNAGARTVELAPNRVLRFIGLNTALICGALKDEEGKLLLGARQRVLPITAGEELVLIAHHPLSWLQDAAAQHESLPAPGSLDRATIDRLREAEQILIDCQFIVHRAQPMLAKLKLKSPRTLKAFLSANRQFLVSALWQHDSRARKLLDDGDG